MILAGIPAYNEAKHISRVVEQTKLYVDKVIVIDDGSKDHTGDLAELSGAKVITHPHNWGVGAAENTIFKYATQVMKEKDILITLDGDGQHFPEDIPKLLDRMNKGDCDFVNGSRLYDKHLANPTPYRRVLNGIATYTMRIMSHYPSTDSQTGFRAYKYEIVKQLRLVSNDYAWNSECFIRLKRMNAKIAEVQVKTIWTPPNSDKVHATLFYGIKVLGRLFLIWTGITK